MNDLIIQNIKQLILPKSTDRPLKGKELDELNIVENGTVVVKDGKIVYSGPYTEEYEAQEVIDASNHVVSPALVDAHTHLVHGGSREHEMSLKRQGLSYLEILERGGGILSTVEATRTATEDELFKKAEHDLLTMIHHGVLAVESKSGYGLDKENELKQLYVSRRLQEKYGIDMRHTFLGPHAVPKEAASNEAFLQEMIDLLPEVKELADFADIFCETGVFSIEDSRRYIQAAKEQGFRVKIHADEIDPLGGLGLAIDEEAISADHLVAASDEDKKKLADTDTVAVLLPGTTFYLGKNDYADARGMLENNGAIAIATDFNPGSCVTNNLQMVMAIAALKLKLSPNEVWNAVTVNAAKAMDVDAGTINTGDKANIVIWHAPNHEYIPYHYGINHVDTVIHEGRTIVKKELNLK
ncbi:MULTISPECIES: imidazolonepropionase [unclassified Staphylococcus]|uniref:imidazolonepropionase n=1 Tax=unclassified Staphylococcus TaxID=91994 RepID=UPI0021CED142|nr:MULTISPECIES: imidazolonepropionase [unclassified Staphylococcus]UXR69331.1 imidazolonepropionase [Staphylococcus sp. IVB6246]UXR71386.1 imidazolonepropionase [Staphylococcus sp. IVB6240]UXR73664.1 imidazolonepropionase [Staphylococcus sp. IVB6238]UXR75982.1 imidazolonepropionase [Staphylococcus sp. IVB6233]UXR80179.1 imidazolonepropionase [Staphylococcus sp. IVB6218]